MTNDKRFHDLFLHRVTLKRDNSLSGFDLALANLMVIAGWTDEDIALTLRYHRASFNSPKLHDKEGDDYYWNTIQKAREKNQTSGDLEAEITAIVKSDDSPQEKEEALLDTLSRKWNIRLLTFTRYMTNPATFSLLTEKGKVDLGTMDGIHDQTAFRRSVAGVTKVLITKVEHTVWDEQIVPTLLTAAADAPFVEDLTKEGQVASGIRAYLREFKPTISGSEAYEDSLPFIKSDGIICFHRKHFFNWYAVHGGDKIGLEKLSTLFQHLKFESKTVWMGGQSEKRWCLPYGFKLEDEG